MLQITYANKLKLSDLADRIFSTRLEKFMIWTFVLCLRVSIALDVDVVLGGLPHGSDGEAIYEIFV